MVDRSTLQHHKQQLSHYYYYSPFFPPTFFCLSPFFAYNKRVENQFVQVLTDSQRLSPIIIVLNKTPVFLAVFSCHPSLEAVFSVK